MRFAILPAMPALVLLATAPQSAQAQMPSEQPMPAPLRSGGLPSQVGPMPSMGPPPQAAPKETQPPALPGAASNKGGAAPATRSPTDMEPTDALFDAINRGDIAAARDAISRGADLRGHNILGMTPLELSVDLGRNDISFLLLSMRAGDGGSQPPTGKTAATPGTDKATKQAPVRRVAAKAAAPAARPIPSQTARLFSGDGGAPIPNAGFLGFDSVRR